MSWFSNFFGGKTPRIYTGKLLSADEVRMALGANYPVFGKLQYAEVDADAVVYLGRATRDALFKEGGVPRWSQTATCTLYASRFVSRSNELFFNASFHDHISKNIIALAAGEVWFHRDGDPPDIDHAIGVCVTNRGPIYIDTQAPDAVRGMSSAERMSRRQIRFL